MNRGRYGEDGYPLRVISTYRCRVCGVCYPVELPGSVSVTVRPVLRQEETIRLCSEACAADWGAGWVQTLRSSPVEMAAPRRHEVVA